MKPCQLRVFSSNNKHMLYYLPKNTRSRLGQTLCLPLFSPAAAFDDSLSIFTHCLTCKQYRAKYLPPSEEMMMVMIAR